MKCMNDNFVSFNPNSLKKQQQKKPIKHRETFSFESTGMASGLDLPGCTFNENHLQLMLGSPWTPLPNFRTWNFSKRTGSDLPTAQNHQGLIQFPPTPPLISPGPLLESPLILLTLNNSETDLGQSLEVSNLHLYKPSSLPPSGWVECKWKVLKAIADAGRSPLWFYLGYP